jgi:hypothetical protein
LRFQGRSAEDEIAVGTFATSSSDHQCIGLGDVYALEPIRRVFHFRNGAQMFDIKPPLDAGLWLTPDKFVAVPR